ncbi:hypothetical protein [Photobacterium profundum]|uniref:hypothetical protein n=1 Tax=Photobacterium profundum TaxID=74109 RepID=UPI0002F0437E|nr:hypothetical protein [Photobacterium profundum]
MVNPTIEHNTKPMDVYFSNNDIHCDWIMGTKNTSLLSAVHQNVYLCLNLLPIIGMNDHFIDLKQLKTGLLQFKVLTLVPKKA